MRSLGRPFLLILLLPASLLAQPPAAPSPFIGRQASQAWAQRADPQKTVEAIHLWQKALQENPKETELLIRLTMACGAAYRQATDRERRIYWADQARRFAERAVKENPEKSWAYAALGEALGQWADVHRGFHSLGAVKRAVEALQKAIQLDSTNFYAHMLLSQFYDQAPKLFSVGNKSKGLEEARLAVKYGPQYAIAHLALARNLKDTGHKEDSIEQLKYVLGMPAPPDAVPETKSNKEDACKALKEDGISCAIPS